MVSNITHNFIYYAVLGDSVYKNNVLSRSDTTPIVVVIPGLTSDSASPVSCGVEIGRPIFLFFSFFFFFLSFHLELPFLFS